MPTKFTFAHMADLHIGAHADPVLKEMELETLRYAIDICIESEIAFLIIAGDIYDSNLPNLETVNRTLKEFMRLREQNIPIYYVYGSHDYSVSQTSIINILESAQVFTKVMVGAMENDMLKLRFVTDPKTQAKLAGVSGRQSNLEKHTFERLDHESLERETGFKIFVYHTGIDEFKPRSIAKMDSLPISLFPQHFQYYAGGHIHKKLEYSHSDYGEMRNPGPIFAGRPQDLEDAAIGEPRGFYLVDVSEDQTISNIEYVNTQRYEFLFHEYDADKKSSKMVSTDLMAICKEIQVQDKIVVLRVAGELNGGKTSDINFANIRKLLMDRGAKTISINRHGLRTRDTQISANVGEKKEEIERGIFQEHIDDAKVEIPLLKGATGINTAIDLLNSLRRTALENENAADYQERLVKEGKHILKAEDLEDED